MNYLKVSAKTNVKALAKSIIHAVKEECTLVTAIGAVAVNKAVKAVAIARSILEHEETSLVCAPKFVDIEVYDKEQVKKTIKGIEIEIVEGGIYHAN